jgi:hypothetical protein
MLWDNAMLMSKSVACYIAFYVLPGRFEASTFEFSRLLCLTIHNFDYLGLYALLWKKFQTLMGELS